MNFLRQAKKESAFHIHQDAPIAFKFMLTINLINRADSQSTLTDK